MTRTLFTLMMAATISLVPLAAQGPRGEGGPHGPGGPRGGGNRLDYLAGYLGLSDTQKSQAQAIFAAADTASETARGQLESARTALNTAVKANASETELDRLAAAVGTVEGTLTGIRAKASAKFYALLTADQKAKYDELGQRRGPRP